MIFDEWQRVLEERVNVSRPISMVDFSCEKVSRDEWLDIAESYFLKYFDSSDSPFGFDQGLPDNNLGFMGRVIRGTVRCLELEHLRPDDSPYDDDIQAVMQYHHFTMDTVPPRLIMREVMALFIRLRQSSKSLLHSLDLEGDDPEAVLTGFIRNTLPWVTKSIDMPETAMILNDAMIDEAIEMISDTSF